MLAVPFLEYYCDLNTVLVFSFHFHSTRTSMILSSMASSETVQHSLLKQKPEVKVSQYFFIKVKILSCLSPSLFVLIIYVPHIATMLQRSKYKQPVLARQKAVQINTGQAQRRNEINLLMMLSNVISVRNAVLPVHGI